MENGSYKSGKERTLRLDGFSSLISIKDSPRLITGALFAWVLDRRLEGREAFPAPREVFECSRLVDSDPLPQKEWAAVSHGGDGGKS